MTKAAPDISPIQLDDNNQKNGIMEEIVGDAHMEEAPAAATATTPAPATDPKPRANNNNNNNNVASAKADPDIHLDHLCQDIFHFAASLGGIDKSQPLETPKYLDDFLDTIESKLQDYESLESSSLLLGNFLKAVDHLTLLIDSVSKFKSFSNSAAILLNLATSQLHRAMLILGDELALLLHKHKHKRDAFDSDSDSHSHVDGNPRDGQDNPAMTLHCAPLQDEPQQQQQQQQQNAEEGFPPFSSQEISIISSVAKTMIMAGYKGECNRIFLITRRCAFEEELVSQGFEKMSIDDAQRMQWETLETEISTWVRVFKRCTSYLFPGELKFYKALFEADHKWMWMVMFSDIASSVIYQLVNLAHAVAMTQRSSEKLFKFLEMHETLQHLGLWLDRTEDCICIKDREELRSELAAASSRLGQVAVSIFCELKASIRSDGKQPGACGSIHPLTRNTMIYLNSACKHKDALEELFLRHLNNTSNSEEDKDCARKGTEQGSMTAQLMSVMGLLDANLEAKSRAYKDPSLKYIFLMNNVSYMLQEIKGSKEMHRALGNTWCRKGSTEIRSCHKNYQRDTWTKVLQCLNQEGLMVNGKVEKPVLKERFKNFNQLFDEIHKTQSGWVVSDKQLQSELRVSISAVIIPAYRGFLGRFGQIFTPGSQDEKHIKYQPEDIEAAIDDLFDGTSCI